LEEDQEEDQEKTIGKAKQNQIKPKEKKACSWTLPWDGSNEKVFISKNK
jgi:hypothetical protein